MSWYALTGVSLAVALAAACGSSDRVLSGPVLPASGDGGAGGSGVGGDITGSGGDPGPTPVDCQEIGEAEDCYEGDPNHAGVGACVMGQRVCELQGEFLVWGDCTGSVAPSREMCSDAEDSDCDGDINNGCLACDGVSQIWTDPFMDGTLKLFNMETAGFDVGPHTHSGVCVTDQARINVCENTTLNLNGAGPAIIGGNGIGPDGGFAVEIALSGTQTSEVFVFADATQAPIAFKSSLSTATKVTIFAIGTQGLTYEGTSGELILGSQGDLTTGQIDAGGDVTIGASGSIFINGDLTAGGSVTIGGSLSVTEPPPCN